MSELFKADVIKIQDNILNLKCTIINPEQRQIYSSRNFALQLLWRYSDSNSKSKAPFYKKVSEEKILDKLWVFSNDYKFIDSVRMLETFSYPIPDAILSLKDKEWKEFWNQEDKLPYAIIEIKVTDAKWLEHLSEGDSWATRAVDYDHT